MRRLDTRGDTIVEVLICLAIVGAALGAAYTLAAQSLAGTQASQERSAALGLAQSQIERLKGATWTTIADLTSPQFCLDASGTKNNFTGSLPALDSDTFASPPYPAACRDVNNLYNVSVLYTRSGSPADDKFTVRVRWPSAVKGVINNEVVAYYRLHQ